jgi:hypothetical protein
MLDSQQSINHKNYMFLRKNDPLYKYIDLHNSHWHMYNHNMIYEVELVAKKLMDYGYDDYVLLTSNWEYERCKYLLHIVYGGFNHTKYIWGHRRYGLKKILYNRMRESNCTKFFNTII